MAPLPGARLGPGAHFRSVVLGMDADESLQSEALLDAGTVYTLSDHGILPGRKWNQVFRGGSPLPCWPEKGTLMCMCVKSTMDTMASRVKSGEVFKGFKAGMFIGWRGTP